MTGGTDGDYYLVFNCSPPETPINISTNTLLSVLTAYICSLSLSVTLSLVLFLSLYLSVSLFLSQSHSLSLPVSLFLSQSLSQSLSRSLSRRMNHSCIFPYFPTGQGREGEVMKTKTVTANFSQSFTLDLPLFAFTW